MKLVTDNIIALLQSCVDNTTPLKLEILSPQNVPDQAFGSSLTKTPWSGTFCKRTRQRKRSGALAHGDRISNFVRSLVLRHKNPPPPERLRDLAERAP